MGASSSRRRRDDYYPPPPPPHHRPPPPPPPSSYYFHLPLPPLLRRFVERQQALVVRNDFRLHKETIRLVPDDADPERLLVTFTFDATTDGSVTIYYFAKEGTGCSFSSVYPELQTPTKIPFEKGLAQRFIQPSGSGVDLRFFSPDELSSSSGEVFPLVVYAEAYPSPEEGGPSVNSTNANFTLAVLEKHHDYQVQVMEQILWVDGVRYELQEFFGPFDKSTKADVADADADDTGKECVICLTEPRNTVVLPCRHMCLCSECAKTLLFQSNKCPICRQPVDKLVTIKVRSPDP